MSVHDQSEENLILQIRLASLDFQRANDNITLEMLTLEKVDIYNNIFQKFHKIKFK